jgi:hypothetical protein
MLLSSSRPRFRGLRASTRPPPVCFAGPTRCRLPDLPYQSALCPSPHRRRHGRLARNRWLRPVSNPATTEGCSRRVDLYEDSPSPYVRKPVQRQTWCDAFVRQRQHDGSDGTCNQLDESRQVPRVSASKQPLGLEQPSTRSARTVHPHWANLAKLAAFMVHTIANSNASYACFRSGRPLFSHIVASIQPTHSHCTTAPIVPIRA